jgi:uncharacterized membrane protein YphA (DoxX/SURF4 family)
MQTGKKFITNNSPDQKLPFMSIKIRTIGIWVLKLLAAVIMLQTLFFKFTASEESVYIFSTLGMEPWGRIGTGVMELIASILILLPRTAGIGAVLGIGLMSGALFFHITKLGYEVKGDGGLLFIYASLVFISCVVLAVISRKDLFQLLRLSF